MIPSLAALAIVAQGALPVSMETPFQATNDYYDFSLVNGRIYYRPKEELAKPWKPFGQGGGLPYRLKGKNREERDNVYAENWDEASAITGDDLDETFPMPESIIAITADDDEIAAVANTGQVFYRRRFANLFVSSEWNFGWGQGKKQSLRFPFELAPSDRWSLGRITAQGAGYKEGPDGRLFEWGPAAVSMETFFWLSHGGHSIFYLDSGTPPSHFHRIEPPFRGRYRAEGINASASTIMLIDRFGAVATKIADFDLLGSTPTHPYCYYEDCDKQRFYKPGDIRSGMSPIRLPGEAWKIHPPILPASEWDRDTFVTPHVTISRTGRGNAERELRVVGSFHGQIGYFHKKMVETQWRFAEAMPAAMGLFRLPRDDAFVLADLAAFSRDPAALETLHRQEPILDQTLQGWAALGGSRQFKMRILDFQLAASPWHAELVTSDGTPVPFELHVVDSWDPIEHARVQLVKESTIAFDRTELERELGKIPDVEEAQAIRKFLIGAKNESFAFVVNALEDAVEIRAVDPLRAGNLQAYLSIESDGSTTWQDARSTYLSRLDVALLQSGVCDQPEELRASSRSATRSVAITSGASLLLELTGMEILDEILDNLRPYRSDKPRPNELRFNVIMGVPDRLPDLARNLKRNERIKRGLCRKIEPHPR